MYFLSGLIGGRLVRLPLRDGLQGVGRDPRNEVRLGDDTVSRRHAELRVADGEVLVRDLGSSNGTWLGGKLVTGERPLRPGDEITFGALTLTLGSTAPPAEGSDRFRRPPPADGTLILPLSGDGAAGGRRALQWDARTGRPDPGGVLAPAMLLALTEAGDLLASPRPLDEVLDRMLAVAEALAPTRRVLLLTDGEAEGQLAVRAARPAASDDPVAAALSRSIVDAVTGSREALLLNDLGDDPRFIDSPSVSLQRLQSVMVAPLFDNRQVIGLLYADNDDPSVRFDMDQLRSFTMLANLIALKITNTRLARAESGQERVVKEVAEAAAVQKRLLPRRIPQPAGYEIFALQIPCHEMAGDLYDVAELPGGRLAISVGDVTGKGVPAAVLMSSVMAGLRQLYAQDLTPAAIAARLQESLFSASDELRFVTLFCGVLCPRTHRLAYANAGHCPPLLLERVAETGCRVETLGSTGLPLGLVAWAEYGSATVSIPPDSLLCLFSDGIPEACVGDEFFGEERLVKAVRDRCRLPLSEIAEGVVADVRGFLRGAGPDDDLTLLLLRRGPAAP